MRHCDTCGTRYARLTRTTKGGATYSTSGCPKCLDDDKTIQAMDALADAAVKMHADSTETPTP